MTIFTLKNINKAFNTLIILDNLSINFDAKKTYGITGQSGSGKSTLLNIIAGLDNPDSGTIFFKNQPTNMFNKQEQTDFLNKKIGLIFQLPYLLQELSVLENVIIKSLINQNSLKNLDKLKKEGMELLDFVGLQDKAYLKPNILSGGEQQRVSIARALFTKPECLIADEPTAHLDFNSGEKIISLLKQSQKEWGATLIIASHDKNIIDNIDIKYELKTGKLRDF